VGTEIAEPTGLRSGLTGLPTIGIFRSLREAPVNEDGARREPSDEGGGGAGDFAGVDGGFVLVVNPGPGNNSLPDPHAWWSQQLVSQSTYYNLKVHRHHRCGL